MLKLRLAAFCARPRVPPRAISLNDAKTESTVTILRSGFFRNVALSGNGGAITLDGQNPSHRRGGAAHLSPKQSLSHSVCIAFRRRAVLSSGAGAAPAKAVPLTTSFAVPLPSSRSITYSQFVGNEAQRGAGGAVELGSFFAVQFCNFTQNLAQTMGGAIVVGLNTQGSYISTARARSSIANTAFHRNWVNGLSPRGGALAMIQCATLQLTANTFTSNYLVQFETAADATFSTDKWLPRGFQYFPFSIMSGGAIYVHSQSPIGYFSAGTRTSVGVSSCTFAANAARDGGAIMLVGLVDLETDGSTFDSNAALEKGE